jgi:predicted extracellular nuclease
MITSPLKLLLLPLLTTSLYSAVAAADIDTVAYVDSTLCAAPATLIPAIQGRSERSPLIDHQLTVRALVSAVKPGMDGFYLLEEPLDQDDSNDTSEGLFVADSQHQPKVGDLLALSGKVAEEKGLTQLTQISALSVCSQGHSLDALPLRLPLRDEYQLEAYEGMLVAVAQTLTISDNYNFARYGQLLLSNGRLFQPSNVAMPGAGAAKVAMVNQLNQLLLDDSSMKKNPPHTFNADHLFRAGNTITGIEGVLHFAFGNYMLEATTPLNFEPTNPRRLEPIVKHQGQLRVASFNVLNYFNGVGAEKKFPTDRGASSKAGFVRQNAKIVAAMKAIKADVFGLMEVENDGYAQHSAINELSHHLSKATGSHYRYVRLASDRLGADSIAVGMIYNADNVALLGKAATLAVTPFDGKNRQPLAQTFKHGDSGEVFTVVVNHFKSKRCPKDKTSANADQGDGQGCWNPNRTLAAKKLAKWLATDPTGSNDQDMLIIGDLNAYAKEQPVTSLIKSGYQNMLEKYQGSHSYSFVYRGLAGYLDHALASPSMALKVVYVFDWHINADEMRLTDYNLDNKPLPQQKDLFRPDAFRSSDHDPLIIEILSK